MNEHNEALERVGETIRDTLAKDDPAEQQKLIDVISLGQRIAEYLQCEVADEGSWVDTGSDGEGYDCHVKVAGREYHVSMYPGSTDAEIEAEEVRWKEEASQWDLLCPRVFEALKRTDPELAAEFDAYVTPAETGSAA